MLTKIKQLIANIKKKKLNNRKRNFTQLTQMETTIFNVIKPFLPLNQSYILDNILLHVNLVARVNYIHDDLEEAKIEFESFKSQEPDGEYDEPKKNYEVLIADRQNNYIFSNILQDTFEWCILKILYSNGYIVHVKVYILEKNSLWLDYDSDVMYDFEDSYLELPYIIEMVKINYPC